MIQFSTPRYKSRPQATHCRSGRHELVGDNVRTEYVEARGRIYVVRRCKTCQRERAAKHWIEHRKPRRKKNAPPHPI